MLSIFPSWLIIIMMFTGSLLFFSRLYRTALVWYVRGRQNRHWEARAELVTIAASIPFGTFFGLFSLEVALLVTRLTMAMGLPFTHLPVYLDFLTRRKVWLVLAVSLFHLARTVPQTIASSKVYAYNLEDKLRSEAAGK